MLTGKLRAWIHPSATVCSWEEPANRASGACHRAQTTAKMSDVVNSENRLRRVSVP